MNFWVGSIYPTIAGSPEFLAFLSTVVETVSGPFEPIILWRVTPDRFFMNGQEIYFITMMAAICGYIVASLLTCRQPFNMDRMLHRGTYARDDDPTAPPVSKAVNGKWLKRFFLKISGIDEQFTRGDKILSISVMVWSLGWGFGSFLLVVVWNLLSPWPDHWWVNWFFISNIVVAAAVGLVTTFWFAIGGVLDLRRMFRDLKLHRANELDDGRVVGHMNADDYAVAHGTTVPPNEIATKRDETPRNPGRPGAR